MAKKCPDCGVEPGQIHQGGCDVERCSACKGQRLSCECAGHDPILSKWDGAWPGTAECERRGWYARENTNPRNPAYGYWAPCAKGAPGAIPDMNRLAIFNQTGKDECYAEEERRAKARHASN